MVASDLVERLRQLPCGVVLLDAVAPVGGDPLAGVHLVDVRLMNLDVQLHLRNVRQLDDLLPISDGRSFLDHGLAAEAAVATARIHDQAVLRRVDFGCLELL